MRRPAVGPALSSDRSFSLSSLHGSAYFLAVLPCDHDDRTVGLTAIPNVRAFRVHERTYEHHEGRNIPGSHTGGLVGLPSRNVLSRGRTDERTHDLTRDNSVRNCHDVMTIHNIQG